MIFFLTEKGNGVSDGSFLPAGAVECSQEQYQSPFDWAVVNGEIVPSPNLLINARAAQVRVLSNTCQQQITGGFASSALGAVFTYASGEVDQRNIAQSAQAMNGGLLVCKDNAGAWSRQPHTKAQAQQVLDDFVTARDSERNKLAGLEAQIEAATTVEAVKGVVWDA